MRHGFAVSAFLLGLTGCGEPPPPTDRAAPPTAARTPAPSAPVPPPVRKAGSMPNVGDVAPEFRVRDHTGTERTLAEFKGRRVVLWFFPKADTPG